MSLPIDRTNLTAAQSNQVPSQLIQSAKNIAAIQTPYDTIDELNNKVNALVSTNSLSPYPPAQYNQLINGNLDVAQRGTSFTNPINNQYTLDRWVTILGGTATFPTITHSQQSQVPGDIFGSSNFYRISPGGAGSGYGADVFYFIAQKIENGTKRLCGIGKKVTVSFYAKSNIAGKRIGVSLRQDYGAGGSPSEDLTGTAVTLTSTWTKYTVTFTTNTLVGKTFGTNNDDNLRVSLWQVWGSSLNSFFNTGAAEVFTGAGNIDIAQVQINVGDIGLPFQPKSYSEEEIISLRFNRRIVAMDVFGVFGNGLASSATEARIFIPFGVRMRTLPTLTSSGNFCLYLNAATAVVPSTAISAVWVNKDGLVLIVTVASGLTVNTPVLLLSNNNAASYLNFDAEI